MTDVIKVDVFRKQRRRVRLISPVMLLNAQREKRLRFNFELYITGQKLLGVPAFITNELQAMEMEDSSSFGNDFDQVLEGATCEFFATDSTPRTLMLTAVTLRKFRLARIKAGEDYRISLMFSCTVLSGSEMCVWAWQNHGADLWMEISNAQLRIGDQEEDDDGQAELPLDASAAERKAAVESMPDSEKKSLEKAGKKPAKEQKPPKEVKKAPRKPTVQ